MYLKIWVDDVRPMPDGYDVHCRTVDATMAIIRHCPVKIINLDHDAGDYAYGGGDYINILKRMEEENICKGILFIFHTMNPVGRENMKAIVEANRKKGWRYVD